MQPNSVKDKYAVAIFQEGKEKVIGHHHHHHHHHHNNNGFISAYPFYMKLALRQKITYAKKK